MRSTPTLNIIIQRFYRNMQEGDMNKVKTSLLSLLAAAFLLGMVACEKEGPMEKAGKAADEAIDKTEKAIKEKTE